MRLVLLLFFNLFYHVLIVSTTPPRPKGQLFVYDAQKVVIYIVTRFKVNKPKTFSKTHCQNRRDSPRSKTLLPGHFDSPAALAEAPM